MIPLLQSDAQSFESSLTKSNEQSLTLSFEKINYFVPSDHRSSFSLMRSSKDKKQILNHVSGIFSSGLNAILGKDSFLSFRF